MFKKVLNNIVVLCLLFFTNQVNAENTLRDMRITGDTGNSRITLEFSNGFGYHAFLLSHPERLVVDVNETRVNLNLSNLNTANTLIKSIRCSHPGDKNLRIVFDLIAPVSLHTANLNTSQINSYRAVFDLTTGRSTRATATLPKNPSVTLPSRSLIRPVVVVIDPGHGGKDPGAIGIRGTQEKDIVLDIAKKLKSTIEKQPGVKAVLTRDRDYYISLRERLSIARKYNADIFIAVHADAYNKQYSYGASIFALSQRGASSEAAHWLAERENHSELGDASLIDKSYLLRFVLLDLSQTATISSSLQLGGEVLANLAKITRLHNHKVEQAGFVVLKSPDIPSILVETGFISNPKEESLLRGSHYQENLANGIAQGVMRYFWQHPPRDSLMAAKQNMQVY
jgi:N-acetylmuramoyl-L-alanine amidase